MGSRARPPQPAADWRRSKPDRVSERFISKLKTAIKSNDEPISIGPGTLLIPAWAQGLANGSAAALIGAGLFLAGTRTVTGSLVGFMFGVPEYRRQISVLHIQVNFPLLLRAPAGRAGSGGCSDLHFHKRRPFGFPQPLLPRIELPIPQTAPRKRPPRSERSNSVRRPIHGTSSTLPSCPVSSHNCAPSSSIGQDVVRIALTKFPWRPSLNLQGLSPIADKPKGVYVPFYERVDAGVSRSCQNEFSLRYNFQSKDSATSWKCESRNGP